MEAEVLSRHFSSSDATMSDPNTRSCRDRLSKGTAAKWQYIAALTFAA